MYGTALASTISQTVRQTEDLSAFLVNARRLVNQMEQCLLDLDNGGQKLALSARLTHLFEELRDNAAPLALTKIGLLTHNAALASSVLEGHQESTSPLVIDRLFRTTNSLRNLFETLGRSQSEGELDVTHLITELREVTRPEALNTTTLNSMTISLHHNSRDNLDALNEVLPEFVADSHEHLDRVHNHLSAFSAGELHPDILDDVFRCFHTIKGVATFLNLKGLEALSHAAETLLQGLRDGETTVRPSHGTSLYHAIQVIRQMLETLQRGGRDSDVIHAPIVNMLTVLANDRREDSGRPPKIEARAPSNPKDGESSQVGTVHTKRATRSHRLDHVYVEHLGELTSQIKVAHSTRDMAALGKLLADLQETVEEMKTQSAQIVLDKTPRLVRRIARRAGKRVQIETNGGDIQLNRNLLSEMDDILTQFIRNAITHGIERPERRLQLGKPAEGRINVSITANENEVSLQVSDDGQGLDLPALRAKAVERGFMSTDAALSLPSASLINLIFEPGFSTAERIGGLAGRGVGLDIVRTTVLGLGGDIKVNTQPKHGTIVTIVLPRVAR